jgi:hypothetical protein
MAAVIKCDYIEKHVLGEEILILIFILKTFPNSCFEL